MFVMVDAQTFEGIQAVLVAVESLVLSEVQTPEENLSRVVAIKDAYKRMK
jgi:hypothetical protein